MLNRSYLFVFVALLLVSGMALAQPLQLHGQTKQGGVLIGKTLAGAKVSLDGKPVMVSKDGDFVLGFGREAALKANLNVVLPTGEKISRVINLDKREYNIQRINGLPPSKVTPMGKKVLARIREENAQVAKARKRRGERVDYANGFIWPSQGRISGVYGSQRVLNGKPRRPHYGVDIAMPTGTAVLAPADGVVTLAHPDMYFSGGTMIIDHGHGLSSTFLHLHKLHVPVGTEVKQGDCVAEIGATGRVTGPHLDWRMNWLNQRVDPTTLVPPMPKDYKNPSSACNNK